MPIARDDCLFFHVIDLPGEASTPGAWDFRQTEAEYHGHYPLNGKSVLEIGTATGAHAFWMEQQGARVTPMDLSADHDWDIMLAPDQDPVAVDQAMRDVITGINNGWTYCRDRLGSKLEKVFGSLHQIPSELGNFDIVTYGSVLLHTRDPIGAVQHGAPRAKEAVIICDRMPDGIDPTSPMVEFIPKLGNEKHFGAWSWWWASPQIYVNLLTILGFKEFQLSTAKHLHADSGNKIELYTLVATR